MATAEMIVAFSIIFIVTYIWLVLSLKFYKVSKKITGEDLVMCAIMTAFLPMGVAMAVCWTVINISPWFIEFWKREIF